MQYEDIKSGNPEEDVIFVEGMKKEVGAVKVSDFVHLREICQSIPGPGKLILQKQRNQSTMFTCLDTFRSPALNQRSAQ